MSDRSLRNQAYEQIRGKLVSGRLAAGSQISEPKLAKMLGIGRTPVREAIQQLQVEGLVERMPRRGTIVCVPDRKDIVDLFELREGLESYAVTLATQRIRSDGVARLRKLCGELQTIAEELRESGERSLSGLMMRRFLAADMGFHLLLIGATGNKRIVKIVSDSHVMSRIFGTSRQEHSLEVVEKTFALHSEILDAVEKSDGERARQRMLDHIRLSLKETLEHYNHLSPTEEAAADSLQKLPMPIELLDEFERIELAIEDDD